MNWWIIHAAVDWEFLMIVINVDHTIVQIPRHLG